MVGKWWTITAALALGSMSVSQLHAADGLYLGAGVGAVVKDSFNTETFDQEDVAYRAFVGWRFDQVPIIDLAVEAAYTNFGKPSQTIVQGGAAQNVEFKLHGASLAGLVILPLGPIDLYAKGGVIDWKADQTVNGSTTGRSGTDAFTAPGSGSTCGYWPSVPSTSAIRSRTSIACRCFR